MSKNTFDPRSLFQYLAEHRVRHIVIGGLAAVAQEVGWPTYDADVVIETSADNLEHLLRALKKLDAEYDTFHTPPIRPDLDRLATYRGPQLFRTKFGRLDVLKEAGGETFESLSVDAVHASQAGISIQCASVAALLRMKKAANRPKDQPAIRKLEAALNTQPG